MKNNFVKMIFLLTLVACSQDQEVNAKDMVSKPLDLKSYWYSNGAEISSYSLTQARYGETHEGKAVLVYVTEPFSKKSNTKADNPSAQNIEVLKLNRNKSFNTGIYDYSMMTSSFYPFENGESSLKLNSSSQEWCGQTFMELSNNGDSTEAQLSSYFENESFKNLKIKSVLLEDDIWTKIRLDPKNLAVGDVEIIPSLFYLRLMHKDFKPYKAHASLKEKSDSSKVYNINYPELARSLNIEFQNKFPYKILSWEEEYESGWGAKKKLLKTKAKLINTIRSDYWNRNTNSDEVLRDELKL